MTPTQRLAADIDANLARIERQLERLKENVLAVRDRAGVLDALGAVGTARFEVRRLLPPERLKETP